MEKLTTISFYLWAVFAIAAFVSAWWLPTWAAIIQWIFGGMNMLTLLSLLTTKIEAIREKNKNKKLLEG